jgi:hypothetical protein
MEIFAWNPAAGAENIDGFNARVAEVCRSDEGAVVDVEPSLATGSLVLSLTEADDLPVTMPLAVLPVVKLLTNKGMLDLEKTLLDLREEVELTLADEEQIIKVKVLSDRDNLPAYAVFVIGLALLQQEKQP